MSEPRETLDELELKKRARRRLVGAIAFASFAAVVLPMVMDETPPPSGHDIELRIPGQDQVASSPLALAKPAASGNAVAPAREAVPAAAPAAPPAAVTATPAPAPAAVVESAKAAPKAAEKAPEKAAEKAPEKAAEVGKPARAKAVEAQPKTAEAPAKTPDAKRAQAILEGGSAAAASGQFVVLIGAFSNPANVKNLQTKLGQLGIKTYTENLDSAQGRKTRVRAGPFPSRDGAEKALDKMKQIGVGGVVAAKS